MSTAGTARSLELCPIDEIEDRRQAMRRVIGPLCTLATVEAIDQTAQSEALLDDTAFHVAELSGDKHIIGDSGWLARGYDRMRSAILMHVGQNNTLETVSNDQAELIYEHTYNERLNFLVSEGFDAQQNVTFRICVPGVIAARHNAEDLDGLTRAAQEYAPSDVAEFMSSPSFDAALHRLSIARNGIYGPVHSVYATGKPVFIRKPSAPQPNTTIYNMFKVDGEEVVLSSTCTGDLQGSLRSQPDSRGCPVNLRVAYVRPDDFGDEQWERMTGGENPIMSYDQASSKLTIERSAITALNGLFVSILQRIAS